jgi:malate dehydrogenase (oxaloacetate-decarboxylating)
MPIPNSSWSITMRVHLGADPLGIGRITTAVGEAGGTVVGVDIVESHPDRLVVDLTCNAADARHAEAITAAVEAVPGAHVHKVSDRTFLLHLGGKLEVTSKVPLRTRDDLSMAYTPGVARVCQAIAANPTDARRLTIKRNTVAVVTDGSAVLGLGNIGPAAALPVMEGKALLFKQFAGVDAWPVCLDTQDTDEIVRTVELLAPMYGGVNLEDIAAPRCFEVERRLRASLDIPVFHDDQHGTAIVVLAGLINALRVVGKKLADVRLVLSGAGAAGVAIIKILQAEGIGEVVACDRSGIIHPGREGLDSSKQWVAEHTNRQRQTGTLKEALVGADVFVGVSAPNLLEPEDVARMAPGAIVFALANPDPEVDPAGARRYAAVVATGRSDEPNQINNVLAFPGVFRGALDAEAREITEEMEVAAAEAIAGRVADDELRPEYIVPSVFDRGVAPAVAEAVREAADGRARRGDAKR